MNKTELVAAMAEQTQLRNDRKGVQKDPWKRGLDNIPGSYDQP